MRTAITVISNGRSSSSIRLCTCSAVRLQASGYWILAATLGSGLFALSRPGAITFLASTVVHAPSAIVAPGNADEARAVVRIAHEQKVAALADQSRQELGVRRVDPERRGDDRPDAGAPGPHRRGEPGAGLRRHRARRDVRPASRAPGATTRSRSGSTRPTARPHGSVIGNALDHGLGTTPYGDHFGNLCGTEVVLADGRVLQTNGAADSVVRHTYKWGTGPYLEGLFGQAGGGVVIRAGVWLMPAPEAYRFFVLELSTRGGSGRPRGRDAPAGPPGARPHPIPPDQRRRARGARDPISIRPGLGADRPVSVRGGCAASAARPPAVAAVWRHLRHPRAGSCPGARAPAGARSVRSAADSSTSGDRHGSGG